MFRRGIFSDGAIIIKSLYDLDNSLLVVTHVKGFDDAAVGGEGGDKGRRQECGKGAIVRIFHPVLPTTMDTTQKKGG